MTAQPMVRTWPTRIALSFLVALVAHAEAASSAPPRIQASSNGESLTVKWEGVPTEAREQEVMISLDGGRSWMEIARPTSISDRQIQVPLPREVDAHLLLAVRAGNEERELEEMVSAPLFVARRPARRDRLSVTAGWNTAGRSRTDPSHGPGEPPRAVETERDEPPERLPRAGEGPVRTVAPGPGSTTGRHRACPSSTQTPDLGSPLDFPLRN